MKLLVILNLLLFSLWAYGNTKPPLSHDDFVEVKQLKLSRKDIIIAEHLVNMIKLIEKGYVNQEIINKLSKELKTSTNFKPFQTWLASIKSISNLNSGEELIEYCHQYTERKESLPLERVLERLAGNYCRERSLEAIGREIEKTNKISDMAVNYIQGNLKFFLTKKNKNNFAYFLQSQSGRPEILKRLSQEVATYSVRNEIVPATEVLKDILINDQITKLIQAKGFNPLQHKNVFYAEFGKLIEVGYRTLNNEPKEKQVKEHFNHMKNYIELNRDHLPLSLCLSRLSDFSKAVSRNGFDDLSRDIFKFVLKSNVKDIQEDATFFYLWTHLSKNEFKKAKKIADKIGLLKKDFEISDPRLRFWVGYIHEMVDEKPLAIPHYEKIVDDHPLSYYAIMSVKKLQSLKPDSPAVTFYKNNQIHTKSPVNFKPDELGEDHQASLVRLRAWSKIDNQRLVKLELKRLSLHSMPKFLVKHSTDKQPDVKSDLHLINAKVIQDSGNHLATFRYLYGVLNSKEVYFNKTLLEMLYPKPYLDQLMKVLNKSSIDPIVLLSLIRQESVFNPLARSHAGARGLMQLMPATAKRMRRSVRTKQLANPRTNIEIGTKYFKGLMKRYDGNLVHVLSAYNAGETRVERWKKQYWDTDDTILKNIEAIPFLETRNYVKLIFRNIFFYKLLLEEQKELADTSELNKIYDISLGFNK